ncbi:MAG TPA: 3-hydroxyacyl-CoA dehydrogenase NAD-binding domain-containing protein [Stellaceae bacterium]|nr:3-hydroxyacyl-CoA dehydrogenase NAD-binding domain-containing protein [Stellaceae bacterium]
MSDPGTVVKSERVGSVAILTIDSPPVNALGHAVRSGIKSALDAALADPAVGAIVIIGVGRIFIAGADITEFGKTRPAPLTSAVIATIEAGQKPVVAAIRGAALGGGLELAMGCDYRLAAPDARLGQPEVKLGMLPGAGGTQRLPRLVGVPVALDMIALGEPIGAKEALDKGLIDEIASGDLRAAALAFAERLVGERRPRRRVRDLPVKDVPSDPEFFARYRATIEKRRRGVIAPASCIAAVEAAVALPFDQGLAREQELFLQLVNGDQAKAQRYFFFAERDAGKIPDLAPDTPAQAIAKAAIIGAGTMGGGIAMCFANVGIPVTLIDTTQAALDRGIATMRSNYQSSASRGGLAAEDVERRMALVTGALAYEAVGDADLVIEAVFEDLPLKQQVFAALDRAAKADAILATNTSYQDVNVIAAATRRPEQVIGLHFFSPANVMRLVEVVRGAKTAPAVLASGMALARKLRKVPVPVGVGYGFVGNRMLTQRSRAAERLLLEGALPQDVDAALVDFGFPMGPFAASDLAGLDVSWRARQARGGKAPVADALCEAGRFGQKTRAGFFRYEPGSRAALTDPEVERIIIATSERLGVARRAIGAAEILQRIIEPMINEGARILEDGIALRAGDIDVIWVYGYGWPVHRGGPMFYADQIGLAAIRDRLDALSRRLDDPALKPAPLLLRLASEGRGFTDAKR